MREETRERLVDLILEESKDEVDDVGEGKYYFSQHSKNLDIIYSFDFDADFLKRYRVIRDELLEEFLEWLKDRVLSDDAYLVDWLMGAKVDFWNDCKWAEDLTVDLEDTYRKRINETYKCEKCGIEVSEKYTSKHPQALHRLGHDGIDTRVRWKTLCSKCFKEAM